MHRAANEPAPRFATPVPNQRSRRLVGSVHRRANETIARFALPAPSERCSEDYDPPVLECLIVKVRNPFCNDPSCDAVVVCDRHRTSLLVMKGLDKNLSPACTNIPTRDCPSFIRFNSIYRPHFAPKNSSFPLTTLKRDLFRRWPKRSSSTKSCSPLFDETTRRWKRFTPSRIFGSGWK